MPKKRNIEDKLNQRKCEACDDPIVINRSSISNIILYKEKYYHKDCFIARATRLAARKTQYAQGWQQALDNLPVLEAEATNKLTFYFERDDLNKYLLEYYNLTEIRSTFWTVIADLYSGIYRGQRCKEITPKEILELWKWGQKNLDTIAVRNKMNNRGPKDGEQRLRYDLAILLKHRRDFEDYLKQKNIAQNEMKENAPYDNIDISRIGKAPIRTKRDLSDIADDIL